MKKRNILITGAAGFIGYHIARHLHKRGDRVIGIDNFSPYYPISLKKARSAQLEALGIPVHSIDLADSSLFSLLEESSITHVVHLAAQAGVRHSLESPHTYLKSNIDGFLTILEALRLRPEIPLIYASSSSVYGWNTTTPFTVDMKTDAPANLYGATKKANELMAYAYHKTFGLHVTGLRFFTVYGPWGRPDMAYWKFAEAILEGREIDLYNFGAMQRDFTYIDDIVQGTLAALDLSSDYALFNLGNSHPIPLLQFVETLEQIIGCPARKNLLPMQPGDIPVTYADISESRRILGYHPTTSLEKGLTQFVAWLQYYKKGQPKKSES